MYLHLIARSDATEDFLYTDNGYRRVIVAVDVRVRLVAYKEPSIFSRCICVQGICISSTQRVQCRTVLKASEATEAYDAAHKLRSAKRLSRR